MAVNPGDSVTCKTCGKTYELTPADDYFHPFDMLRESRTTINGQCERCILAGRKLIVVNPEVGEQLQEEYEERSLGNRDQES